MMEVDLEDTVTVTITDNSTGEVLNDADFILKKERKKYELKNPRETWTEEEHKKFVESVKINGRDWHAVAEDVGTKNLVQIRSHAQKYFDKLIKANRSHEIPPSRNKRKRESKSQDSEDSISLKRDIADENPSSPSTAIPKLLSNEKDSETSPGSIDKLDYVEINEEIKREKIDHIEFPKAVSIPILESSVVIPELIATSTVLYTNMDKYLKKDVTPLEVLISMECENSPINPNRVDTKLFPPIEKSSIDEKVYKPLKKKIWRKPNQLVSENFNEKIDKLAATYRIIEMSNEPFSTRRNMLKTSENVIIPNNIQELFKKLAVEKPQEFDIKTLFKLNSSESYIWYHLMMSMLIRFNVYNSIEILEERKQDDIRRKKLKEKYPMINAI